jgi:inorganic pyrophosphatase
MVKHPWHGVAVGTNPPEFVNGIIEIPKGSRAKYEIDKDSGLIKLDRVLYASMYYPLNYGFIPQTLGEDHDPLDIVVLTQVTVVPRCIIPSKVIGVMRMIDRGEADDKIIAVAEQDASVSHFEDVDHLPEYFKVELKHFFENYKVLENKKVIVDEFQSKEKAMEIILQSIEFYKKTFTK